MSAASLYNEGLGRWNAAASLNALMVDSGYTFDRDHEMADVTPETIATGYARTGTFSLTESVDNDRDLMRLVKAAVVTFGTIAADDATPFAIVVYDDADDTLLLFQEIDALMRTEFPDVRVSPAGLVFIGEAAP